MEQEYRINFIKNRLVELKNSELKLIEDMMKGYTKNHRYRLLKIKEQILENQKLILSLDEGEEEYRLEN